ncbi:hypothetical protein NXY07_03890 [Phocaeicola dorei]|nr:hypothetical protein [Phocaeicola dorei]
MKKVLLLVFLSLAWLSVSAQALVPITWTAYGLTFEAQKGFWWRRIQRRLFF